MRLAPLATLALLACSGDDTKDDTTDISVSDTDTDTDADTDADTDTDADADTDTDADADTDTGTLAAFSLSGALNVDAEVLVPAGDVIAVLLEQPDVNVSAFGAVVDAVDIGPVGSDTSTPYTLTVPGVPPESAFHAPDDEVPLMELAVYVVGFYIDEDGDGVSGADDTYLGVGSDLLIYVRGALSDDVVALGGDYGWNELTDSLISGQVAIPFEGDRAAFDAWANLLPLPGEPLDVTIEADLSAGPPGERRLDLWNAGVYLGAAIADPTVATMALPQTPPPFDVTLPAVPSPPAADHLLDDLGDGPLGDLRAGAYEAIAYVDVDGDQRFDPLVDATLGSSGNVDPTELALPLYLHATDFSAVQYSAAFGGSLGWLLLVDDGTGTDVLLGGAWSDGLVVR